jgi:H+-transporting ATPase
LQRLTIVHETDHTGSYYRFASGSQTPAQPQQEDKKGTGKDSKTNKTADDAKSTKGKGGAAEGDKTMSDHAGKGGESADLKQDKGKTGQTTPAQTRTQTQTPAPEEEGESSSNVAKEDEESSTATRVDDKA